MNELSSYPKWKYHPEKEAVVIESIQEEKELGPGWFDSPAAFGVETCPGVKPDPQFTKRKKLPGAK